MKTNLHHYYFSLDNPNECQFYLELRERLNVSHAGKFFNALAMAKSHDVFENKTETVDLDTSFLFENQWNETTASGNRRLFDWYEGIYPSTSLKAGHWLEITPEMDAIRRNTLTCGYCGKYVPITEPHKWHCEKCLGNEYLEEKNLGLLRLLPVADSKHRSLTLMMDEYREILPLYKEAQGLGMIARDKAKASRNRKKVADLIPKAEAKSKELLEAAKVETEALTWVLDHELNLIDNVIYYTHTKRFCFGWRVPLTAEERSKLLDVISEFPFDYDLK